MSKIAIEKARQIHRRHPGLTFPLDIERLAALEGCECVEWPFQEPIKEVKQGRWIGLAGNLPEKERRYLITHALAHHLLHRGNQLSFRTWEKICSNRQEKEADCCAAHILMPEGELIEAARLPCWEIADRFGVPEDLARQRMTLFATDEEKDRWDRLETD